MADLSIMVSDISISGSNLRIGFQAITSTSTSPFGGTVEVAFNSLASTINNAIKDEAIAQASAQQSITVGALDKKTIYAGAVEL